MGTERTNLSYPWFAEHAPRTYWGLREIPTAADLQFLPEK
jgi:hypothetical protein